jgi:hypothetical protein
VDADSRLGGWLLKLAEKYGRRLSVDDRLQLASSLLRPPFPASSAEDERPESPRWSRQRRRLWALVEFAHAAHEVLDAEDVGVTCVDLAKQCRAMKDDLENAMTLLRDVEAYGGLGVPHGADLVKVRHALACQHAEEVDADLGRRGTTSDPDQPPWTISYDYRNGEVTATCAKVDADGRTAYLLRGFAPTPAAAADLVVSWHTTAPPMTFDYPPPARYPLRVAYRESTPLSATYLDPVTLVERGGACYEEFLAACGRIRAELRAAGDVTGWLRRRADHLNRTTPHVPDRGLSCVVRSAHGHLLGRLNGIVLWVRPELVISTYSEAWGEFGGHREDSLTDIAAGLAATDDLPAFTRPVGRFGTEKVSGARPAWRAVQAWIAGEDVRQVVLLRGHLMDQRRWQRVLEVRAATGISLVVVWHGPRPDRAVTLMGEVPQEVIEHIGPALEAVRLPDPPPEQFQYSSPEGSLLWDQEDGEWMGGTVVSSTEAAYDFCSSDVTDEVMEAIVEVIPEADWTEDDFAQLRPDEALRFTWEAFRDKVKYSSRFVFLSTPEEHSDHPDEFTTGEFLQKVDEVLRDNGTLLTVPAGRKFWRGRLTDDPQDAQRWNSAADLGPPPRERASNSRMSPAGIAMFYGSDDVATAIAEIGAHNSQRYAILGEFDTIKDLTLLDLTDLPDIPSLYSEAGRTPRYYDLLFLHRLAADLGKPIALDGHEHIE